MHGPRPLSMKLDFLSKVWIKELSAWRDFFSLNPQATTTVCNSGKYFAGLSKQYDRPFFKKMEKETGIKLENIVYYQGTKYTLHWKSETYIPRNETVRPHISISTFMYLWAIFIFPWSVLGIDRSWEYINCSEKHECHNWETEHYNSVLEITRPCSFISRNT